eukprot:tig00000851_g4921.t1
MGRDTPSRACKKPPSDSPAAGTPKRKKRSTESVQSTKKQRPRVPGPRDLQDLDEIKLLGFVQSTRFHKPATDCPSYAAFDVHVLWCSEEALIGQVITASGAFPSLSACQILAMAGPWRSQPPYGAQLKVQRWEDMQKGTERYKSSSSGKGAAGHQLNDVMGFLLVPPAQSPPPYPEEFVAWDLETTGLDLRSDEILSIGAVRFRGGHPTECFSTLVALPEGWRGRIHPEALAKHGITAEKVQGAPSASEAIKALVDFAGPAGTFVVGHRIAKFDAPLLLAAAGRAGVPEGALEAIRGWAAIDTIELSGPWARRRRIFIDSFKLENLAARFKIPLRKAHDALQDAEASGRLLLHLMEEGQALADLVFRPPAPAPAAIA